MFRRLGLLCAALVLAVAIGPAGALCRAQEPDYGYSLKSSGPALPYKPYLLLNPGDAFRTHGKPIELSFNFRNPRTVQFGYFLRIACEKGENLDLLYYVNDKRQFCIAATLADRVAEFSPFETTGVWETLSVRINPDENSAFITCADETLSLSFPGQSSPDGFRIIFGDPMPIGACHVEVADLDIRDINLNAGGKIFNWKLCSHGDGFCLDSCRNAVAKAEGGSWIVDRHCNWKPLWHSEVETLDGVAFDGTNFQIVADGYITEVGPDGKLLFSARVRGGFPAISNQFQTLCYGGKLISYLVDDGTVSEFDMASGRWSSSTPFAGDYLHLGNTTSIDPESGIFYSFGGYGLFHFSQDFTSFSPTGKFYRTSLPEAGYRFKSASAFVDGKFFIHGGYSSINGNQAFAVKYYNDLICIDPADSTVTYLWNAPRSDTGAPMGVNMIWDQDNECFYAVMEQSGATLLRIHPDTSDIDSLSAPAPAIDGILHQVNLHHIDGGDRLYLSVISSGKGNVKNLDIYNMNWPPIDCADIAQSLPDSRYPFIWVLLPVLLLAACVALFFIFRRKRGDDDVPVTSGTYPSEPVYDFSRSSVCFFGGFSVKDKEGRDITSMFSPTLKSILVLIVLSTPRGGIASSRLDRIIWSYIPEDSAANSRNVQISRLRSVLSQIGGFEIRCSNKIWTANCSDGVLCDYLELFRHLAAPSSSADVASISQILSRGALLPNMEQPWVDVIRKEVVSKCVDFADFGLRCGNMPVQEQLLLADIVLKYDYMNENAVLVKCRCLYVSGQIGVAKSVFDNFAAEYVSVTGLDYPMTFKQVIKTKDNQL